jgi:hypothetical protein
MFFGTLEGLFQTFFKIRHFLLSKVREKQKEKNPKQMTETTIQRL